MLVNDKDALKRLNSPQNLINKMKDMKDSKRGNAMALFGIGKKQEEPKPKEELVPSKQLFNPFDKSAKAETPAELPTTDNPNIDTILTDADAQIKLKQAHDTALDLLTKSVSALSAKLNDVSASKLPSVIAAASKTVESIRKERAEVAKNNKGGEVHFHFYTPDQKKMADYEVIDVPA